MSDDFVAVLTEGTPGPPGAPGPPGPGVPAGGATSQVLAKTSAADYATGWTTPAAGGGGTVLDVTAEQTANYIALANQFVLCNTTGGSITITMPTTPPNGTLVGGRISTFGAGTTVSFNGGGGGDVFNKPGGPANAGASLVAANTSITYVYDAGVWVPYSTASTLGVMDARYVNETDVVTLAAGQDLQVNAPVGGVQTVQVTDTQHAIWQPTVITAAADQTVNNSTALVNDTEMTFAYLAGATYDVDFRPIMIGTITEMCRFNVSCTGAGVTFNYAWENAPHTTWTTGASAIPQGGGYALALGGGDAQWALPASSLAYRFRATGRLTTAAVGGTFTLRWAQRTAGVSDLVRKAGSYIVVRRLA